MSWSAKSEGSTVDALELKLTGTTGLDDDLRRGQEVQITVRGKVMGHSIMDKLDKHGDIEVTVKSATVKVDELREIEVLAVPRRMKGQTAMDVDGEVVDQDAPEGEQLTDAEIVGELEAGPDYFDRETGELHDPPPGDLPEDEGAEFPGYGEDPELDSDASAGAEALEPAEAEAEVAIAEVPPPVSDTTGPRTVAQLIARQEYLRSRKGLPVPLAEARDTELVEISRRLVAQGHREEE